VFELASSYFEKLLWHFLKTRIFGGIFLFLSKETVMLTASMIVILGLEYVLREKYPIVPLMAIILVFVGLVLRSKCIRFYHSGILSAVIFVAFYINYVGLLELAPIQIGSDHLFSMILLSAVFAWFLINSMLLILQVAEFFASTAGLYILWGSDERRIFLSPIPQILLLCIIMVGVYLFLRGFVIDALLVMSPAMILFFLLYVILINSGRIVRSAIAMYIFFTLYLIIGYVYKFGAFQNILGWVIITMFSTFFVAQSRAAMIAKEETGTNGYIIVLIGVILLIGHALLPINGGTSIQIDVWWLLSLLASITAPVIFYIYIRVTGRLKRYIERDKTPTHIMFMEMLGIVGSVLIKEVTKLTMSRLSNLFRSFLSDEK